MQVSVFSDMHEFSKEHGLVCFKKNCSACVSDKPVSRTSSYLHASSLHSRSRSDGKSSSARPEFDRVVRNETVVRASSQ